MALDQPNIAPKQKNGNENNPPKSVSNSPNSSSVSQKDGPSLPKNTQGVLKDTLTEWNNAIPTAGCPIKLPNLYNKIQTKFKLFPEVEANRVKEWAKKLGEFMAPIVEVIDNAVKALKQMMKEIQDYIDEMMSLFKEIQEWVQLTKDFISFVLSLPARLAQLIQNCLTELVGNVQQFVSDTYNNFKEGLEQGLGTANTTIPLNTTANTY